MRSDPHLAAMFAIFARLSAGEAINSREQSGIFRARMRRAGVWSRNAIARFAAGMIMCASWVSRCVGRAFAAARRGPANAPRAASDKSPERPSACRDQPGLPLWAVHTHLTICQAVDHRLRAGRRSSDKIVIDLS